MHDFLLDLRGAERVFLELCAMWPDADIFTAVYDEHGTEGRFADRNVTTTFLQKLHPTARTFRALLPLYPAAVESIDLSGYDVVISSSSAWAHAVLCGEHNRSRQLLPQPVSLHLERARRDTRAPGPDHARGAADPVRPLAPVGLDRRAADGPVRGEFDDHP